MIVLEGKVVSKSINNEGEIFCGIEIPDHQYDVCKTLLRVKANYELGEVVEVSILTKSEQ